MVQSTNISLGKEYTICNNMITKNIGKLIELSSKNGYIHKKGTENYFKKGIIIDSVDNYEEVDELPKYTQEEYKQKVRELVKEKYTIEDELAIQRNAMNALITPTLLSEDKVEEYSDEYLEYNIFVEECKDKAKVILNNKD